MLDYFLFKKYICAYFMGSWFTSQAETILLYTGLGDKTCPNFCKDQSILSQVGLLLLQTETR